MIAFCSNRCSKLHFRPQIHFVICNLIGEACFRERKCTTSFTIVCLALTSKWKIRKEHFIRNLLYILLSKRKKMCTAKKLPTDKMWYQFFGSWNIFLSKNCFDREVTKLPKYDNRTKPSIYCLIKFFKISPKKFAFRLHTNTHTHTQKKTQLLFGQPNVS